MDHNYPHAEDMTVLNAAGAPVEGVAVRVFSLAAYSADDRDTWIAETITDINGHWVTPAVLDDAMSYIVHFEKTTMYGPVTLEITT